MTRLAPDGGPLARGYADEDPEPGVYADEPVPNSSLPALAPVLDDDRPRCADCGRALAQVAAPGEGWTCVVCDDPTEPAPVEICSCEEAIALRAKLAELEDVLVTEARVRNRLLNERDRLQAQLVTLRAQAEAMQVKLGRARAEAERLREALDRLEHARRSLEAQARADAAIVERQEHRATAGYLLEARALLGRARGLMPYTMQGKELSNDIDAHLDGQVCKCAVEHGDSTGCPRHPFQDPTSPARTEAEQRVLDTSHLVLDTTLRRIRDVEGGCLGDWAVAELARREAAQ